MSAVFDYLKYAIGKRGKSGWGSGATAEEVADKYADRLKGKLVVVTGCNTGIGEETVRVMAKHGAKIIMACRNMTKCEATAAKIRKENPEADLIQMELDLSSLTSVRTFSKAFLSKHSHVDILINNAGIMSCPRNMTDDGYESQFATNHLGHFLLTRELSGALSSSKYPARVVVLASDAHKTTYKNEGIRFDDLQGEKLYNAWRAYGQSKLANVLFAKELNRRMKQEGSKVTANAVHPGVIVTDLWQYMGQVISVFASLLRPLQKSVRQGAATSVYVALAPELDGQGGMYFSDCNEAYSSEFSQDEEMAKKLWQVSEKMCA